MKYKLAATREQASVSAQGRTAGRQAVLDVSIRSESLRAHGLPVGLLHGSHHESPALIAKHVMRIAGSRAPALTRCPSLPRAAGSPVAPRP